MHASNTDMHAMKCFHTFGLGTFSLTIYFTDVRHVHDYKSQSTATSTPTNIKYDLYDAEAI